MGCGSSMDSSSVHGDAITTFNKDPIQIVQEFVRLDEKISELEPMCPGPRMATAEAWVEHMQMKRNEILGMDTLNIAEGLHMDQITEVALGSLNQNPTNLSPEKDIQILQLNDKESYNPTNGLMAKNGVFGISEERNQNIVANTPNKDLASLALSLGVLSDVNKASTHEDFFANLSESALYILSLRYYTEVLEHSKVRLKKLVDEYAILNDYYLNQDGIIAYISGGTYMSRLEESIDAQLEISRDIRDKMGSKMEQWRICGTLIRACANSATLSLQQWRHLAKLTNPKDKIQTALECRRTLQASLVSLDCAQLALPHVAIKHVSQRMILAVRHCNIYMLTDIANISRYEHTAKVFATYEGSMSKASMWLFETYNNTLRKDFDKADEEVQKLAKNLRDHRSEIFTNARK